MPGLKLYKKVSIIESFLLESNLKQINKILLIYARKNIKEIFRKNKKLLWIFFLKLKDFIKIFCHLLKNDKKISRKLKRKFKKQ